MTLYKNRILIEKWPISKEDMFFELIQDLEVKVDLEKFPYSTFFFKNKEIWFEIWKKQDEEYGYFYCSYNKMWSIFKDEYRLNSVEIKYFIKDMIEKYFKMNLTPHTQKGLIRLSWKDIKI